MNGCGNREKRPEKMSQWGEIFCRARFLPSRAAKKKRDKGRGGTLKIKCNTPLRASVSKTTQPKFLRVLSSSPSSSCLSHKVCINHCTSPRGSTNGDEMRSISHPRLRESLAQLREATLTDLSAGKVQSQPPLSGLSQHTSRVSLNNHPNQSQPRREPRLLLYYTGRCRGRRVKSG